MATKFKKKWRATCPKCSRSLSQADFKCSNCTRGHMFVSEIIQRFGTAGKIREVFFGCSVCGQPSPFTACPSPGCGAQLHEPVVKTGSQMPAWMMWLIAIFTTIMIFTVALSGSK